MEKTKQQIQLEIERARRRFHAAGRKAHQLIASEDQLPQNAKPRKQRLRMFA